MVQNTLNACVFFQDSQSIQCYLCNFSTLSFLEMSQHLREEHKFDSDSMNILSVELKLSKVVEGPPESRITCPTCLKVFKNFKGMRQHVGKIHNTKNPSSKLSKVLVGQIFMEINKQSLIPHFFFDSQGKLIL